MVETWLHIAAESQVAADRYLARVEAGCSRLAAFPELGPARPDIAVDARMLVVDRWLILYRIEQSSVQIVRIVDGARDITMITMADGS
jgi:toxin ParE1/3/4